MGQPCCCLHLWSWKLGGERLRPKICSLPSPSSSAHSRTQSGAGGKNWGRRPSAAADLGEEVEALSSVILPSPSAATLPPNPESTFFFLLTQDRGGGAGAIGDG